MEGSRTERKQRKKGRRDNEKKGNRGRRQCGGQQSRGKAMSKRGRDGNR